MGKPNPERDAKIVASITAGSTLAKVGESFGISRDRVRQILAKAERQTNRAKIKGQRGP